MGAIVLVVEAFDEGGLAFLDLQHVPAPGEGEVILDDGGWTLYWEPERPPFGETAIVPPRFDVEITDAKTGREIDTDPYAGELHVGSGGRRGRAILTFQAPAEGRYSIRSSGFTTGERGTLGVGRGLRFDAGSLFLGIAVGLGGFLAAAFTIGFTAVKRYQARSRARPTLPPPPPGQWGAPPAAPPPPPEPLPPPAPPTPPPSGPMSA